MALLPNWHATDKSRKSFRNDQTGVELTRRQYDKVANAQKLADNRSEAIKQGVARANERARRIQEEFLADGLDLNITEVRKTSRYKEETAKEKEAIKEAKKATKQAKKQQQQPAQPPQKQPLPIQHRKARKGQADIYWVGKEVADRAEAEAYEPYRPDINDVLRLIQGIPDIAAVLIIAGGLLRYKADDGHEDDAIEYVSFRATAGVIRKLAARVDTPEDLLRAFVRNSDPVIVTYWSRVVWNRITGIAPGRA